jgi:hypothetical protein
VKVYADTSTLRGPKRHAKTDKQDARHLREQLACGRLPESWISPAHVLEVRTLVRCYKALLDEHTAWLRRVHATLFHHSAWEPASALLLPVTLTVGFGFSIGAWAGWELHQGVHNAGSVEQG